VFIPGLIRSDVAFITQVIATVRPWRQYVRSVHRLYDMERKAKNLQMQDGEAPLAPAVMSPAIEWWVENFSLFSDIVTRRYPFVMVAYDSVVESPERTLRHVFEWLGEGDVDAAIREVEPALRTQEARSSEPPNPDELALEPEVVEVFDTLYDVVRHRRAIDQAFVDRLNAANELLAERIDGEVKRVAHARRERQRRLQEARLDGAEEKPAS
jgi:hypothetical protein